MTREMNPVTDTAPTRRRPGSPGRPVRAPHAQQRGMVLILVVAALLLVLILGLSYLEVVRVDRRSTINVLRANDIHMVTQSVLDLIYAKAAQDMAFDGTDPFQKDHGDGIEPYDYPGQVDPWLSPTFPQDDGSKLVWRHIALLTNQYADGTTESVNNGEAYRNPAGGFLEAEDVDVAENQGIRSGAGVKADADGDGIVDSKWFEAPIFTLRGREYYASVRVIDLSGLINVNAATSMISQANTYGSGADTTRGYFPTNLDLARLTSRHNSGAWLAEMPQILNYRGVSGPTPTQPSPIGLTSGTVDTPEAATAGSVTERFFNHLQAYGVTNGKFSMADEFELRYRNGLNDEGVVAYIEDTAIADSLMIATNTAKKYSDLTSTGYAGLQNYMLGGAGATSPFTRNYATIRHMLTTISGSVDYAAPVAAPVYKYRYDLRYEDGGPTNGNATRVTNMYDRIRAVMADGPGYGGGGGTVDELAMQLALNIQDFTDADNKPTVAPTEINSKTFLGNEKLPYVRAVYLQAGYIDTDTDNLDADNDDATGTDSWELQPGSVAVAVEIGNPFPQKIDFFGGGGANVRVRVNGAEFQLAGEIEGRDDSHVSDTILVVSNPTTAVDELDGNGPRAALETDLTLPVGYNVTNKRVELAAPGLFAVPVATDVVVEMLVECSDNVWRVYDRFTVPGLQYPANATHLAEQDRATLQNRHFQAVAERNTQGINYLSNAGNAFRIYRPIDAIPYDGYGATGHNLADDAKPTAGGGLDTRFQMTSADRPMYTPAEIGMIFALGVAYDETAMAPIATMPEVIDAQAGVADYTLNLTSVSDIPKVPHGMLILDQFTAFSTRNDGVDNDQDGLTDIGADADEHFQPGKANINTMSYEALCYALALPETTTDVEALVQAIMAYRDSTSHATLRAPVRDNPTLDAMGIASIAELLAINPGGGGANTDMQRYGFDTTDQTGDAVDLYPMPEDVDANTGISAPDSPEEILARFQFFAGAFSTRSDVFAAYVRVRGFPAGEENHANAAVEKRVIVVFTRANMVQENDAVQVLGVYEY